MPSAPDPITSPPDVPGQPWDATASETVGKWVPVDERSGEAGPQGTVTGEFPSDGASVWKQT
jgi:hypothetical protein